jgi:carboxypeptidase C (cathepsin A)
MKSKSLFVLIILLIGSNISFAQIKKETTSVKVDITKDTIINFKKPQKSITEGSVSVEGKRIPYQAVAGTLILKNNLDSPTISMSYVAYFKNDEKDPSQRPLTFI